MTSMYVNLFKVVYTYQMNLYTRNVYNHLLAYLFIHRAFIKHLLCARQSEYKGANNKEKSLRHFKFYLNSKCQLCSWGEVHVLVLTVMQKSISPTRLRSTGVRTVAWSVLLLQ